nr:MAG TPA: hypothetical protein [Caudoviricetes sp.]
MTYFFIEVRIWLWNEFSLLHSRRNVFERLRKALSLAIVLEKGFLYTLANDYGLIFLVNKNPYV